MDMSGMDMGNSSSSSTDMNSTSSMAMTMMTAFTTQLGASNLWFTNWTPTTVGSTFGACVGVFFLAMASRLLSATRSSAEIAWAHYIAGLNRQTSRDSATSELVKSPVEVKKKLRLQRAPPFTPSIDIPRAFLFALHSFVGYMLMLIVMTYNAWFFIAVIFGLSAGELAFGRFAAGHAEEGLDHH
ncbi:protein of ctr copper transporter family [Pseudohyphozyma bogoriensis]|nr:protein of ctr copper transporter family [Pseudohyphozyma bogoriensis]